MKKTIFFIWLAAVFGAIGCLFWYSDWKYSLPTPIPKGYHPVALGSPIALGDRLGLPGDKPVFIHFFNPDCPCSRFNIPDFRSLAKRYGDRVSFAIVVLNNDRYSAKKIQSNFDLDIPVSFDSTIAAACGVYSTPQAVLLDASRHLYFRGNYNKSRYCADPRSDYARMAIDSLINHAYRPVFNSYALKAYGCQLPVCTQK